MSAALFQAALKERADALETVLDRLLPPAGAPPATIHEAMRYSALGGGKRLRGVMALEGAKLGGTTLPFQCQPEAADDAALSAAMGAVGAAPSLAAAVEMVHAYSLIHDDLPCMDDDDYRRGRLSNHKVFGEAMAVLAGDALLTRAFEIVFHLPAAGVDAGIAASIGAEIARAAGTVGLIGGQVADLEAEGALSSQTASAAERRAHQQTLLAIHRRKTGALFGASLRCGALLAGVDEDGLRSVDQYADSVGVAFQITDDILDVVGKAETLGKAVGSDQKMGKLTFPALYGLEAARAMAKDEVEKAKEALAPFGPEADFLRALADFVLRRDH